MTDSLGDFQLEWRGNAVIVTPAPNIESLSWDAVDPAAQAVMGPLQDQPAPMLVVDLSRVAYFGSVFLALLLKLHKLVQSQGGEVVLCGAGELARELLQITNLDTLWAVYDTREAALDALAG